MPLAPDEPFDLATILAEMGEAGFRVATEPIATRADRIVASFACALLLWMLERNPKKVWRDGEAFIAEVERDREQLH